MEVTLDKLEKKHGGARKGAGSKLGAKYKKTIAKEAATMYLIRRIEENIEPLATALLQKALEGDMPALKEAFERGLGKVKEVHKMEGKLTIVDMASEIIKKHALDTSTEPDSE